MYYTNTEFLPIDIEAAIQEYLNILKVDIPTLMGTFFARLPETQIVKLFMAKSTELIILLQEKLTVLKNQYPMLYATVIDLFNKVVVPAYSDLIVIYGKLTMIAGELHVLLI